MIVTPAQQTVVMVFGAALAIAGIALFTWKHFEGESTAKIFGIEVTVKNPSIVIFVLGCAIFLAPFVPFFRPEQIRVVPTGTPTVSPTVSPSPHETIAPLFELKAEPVYAAVADDGSVWVALKPKGSLPRLVRLDADTVEPDRGTNFEGEPVQVRTAEGWVWVLTREGVLRFDPNASDFDPLVRLGGPPLQAYPWPRQRQLWILLPDKDVVVRLDMDTNEVVGDKIHVGNYPRFITLASGTMWVASIQDKRLTQIDSTGSILEKIRLPATPVSLINVGDEPVVATRDGIVRRVEVDATPLRTPKVAGPITDASEGNVRLIKAVDHIWAWQEGNRMLWKIDPTTGSSRERLPLDVEKFAELDDVLWAVAADGRIAAIDARNFSVDGTWETGDQASFFVRVEVRSRLLLLAKDGSVYELPP